MSEKTSMPKEVMEWVVSHIHYYCPMDKEAEDVMGHFVSNMYLENWEAASDQCTKIFDFLGNNFYVHINGMAEDRKIVSEYLDAHTCESTENGREYPIGCFKGDREELEKKIGNKRFGAMRMDEKIDMEGSARKEENWILAGMFLGILSLIFLWISVLETPYKRAALGLFFLSGTAGYIIYRINHNRKCFWEKMIQYYREMVSKKMVMIMPEDGQEKIILHRVMPEYFYKKIREEEKESNIKKSWQELNNRLRYRVQQFPVFGRFIAAGAIIVIVLFMIRIIPGQGEQMLLVLTEQAGKELAMPDEKAGISVKQMDFRERKKERTDEEEPEDSFAKEGVIFKDSNERELQMEEIEALKLRTDMDYQEALGYARNEIYARMGYRFGHAGGKYTEHYSQYEWYQDIPKKIITEDMFNPYERANIDLILKAEEELRRQK